MAGRLSRPHSRLCGLSSSLRMRLRRATRPRRNSTWPVANWSYCWGRWTKTWAPCNSAWIVNHQKSKAKALLQIFLRRPQIQRKVPLVKERRGTHPHLVPSSPGSFVQPSPSTSSYCSSSSCPVLFPCQRATPAVQGPTTLPGPSTPCYATPTAHHPLDRDVLWVIGHWETHATFFDTITTSTKCLTKFKC